MKTSLVDRVYVAEEMRGTQIVATTEYLKAT